MSGLEPGGRRVDAFARLVQLLTRLPGIGEKTATRLAFFLVRSGHDYIRDLAEALLEVSTRIRLCRRCMNLTDEELCGICLDPRRDPSLLCVVEQVADLRAIERTHEFRGRYHVLHGAVAPLSGVGPDALKIRELLERMSTPEAREVREIIIATNPSVDGEATALYLLKVLGVCSARLTRIASGLPMGGDLEYADPATIARALSGRRDMA